MTTITHLYHLPRVLYYLHQVRRNQWLDHSQIEEIQWNKIKAIVTYAYHHVEFYRQRFDDVNIKPSDLRTQRDLHKLPIITREDVQQNLDQIVATGINLATCEKIRTAGSTGIPLTVFKDRRAVDFQHALALCWLLECGGRYRDQWVDFRDSVQNPVPPPKSFLQHFGILRKNFLTMTDHVEELIHPLQELQPDIMRGWPSFLEVLAQTVNQHDEGHEIQPRLICSIGELLDRNQRMRINSTFALEMFDLYSCTEAPYVAWECSEHAGYHINTDAVLVEFLKDGEPVAPGEPGELVLTSLTNYAMPFIRYNIGDIGVPSDASCPCGRGLPLMEILEGRSDDVIVLPSGRHLSPMEFSLSLFPKHSEGIAHIRIVQETTDRFKILVVLMDGYSNDVVKRFKTHVHRILKKAVTVDLEVVDTIPKDPSGKFRRFISKVPH